MKRKMTAVTVIMEENSDCDDVEEDGDNVGADNNDADPRFCCRRSWAEFSTSVVILPLPHGGGRRGARPGGETATRCAMTVRK